MSTLLFPRLPGIANEPASFCTRVADVKRAVGEGISVPAPPVLWLAPRNLRARPQGGAAHPAPLWWAGTGWRSFPSIADTAPHALGHAAYVPRRFQPSWHLDVLLQPSRVEAADVEVFPWAGGPTAGGSNIVRVLNLLLCQRGKELWARSLIGSEWCLCPHRLDFQLARTEVFEVCGGNRYFVFLRGRGGGGGGRELVLLYDLRRSAWLPPVGPTRSCQAGHLGEAPVPWRPVERLPEGGSGSPGPLRPDPTLLHAWLVEATSEYLVLLAPVSRDGLQREDEGPHCALHFVGHAGEVVSHHLACRVAALTIQRYDGFMLFVRDSQERAASWADDDWHPTQSDTAAWLLDVADVATPPQPVHLPKSAKSTDVSWSLVLARGSMEELAPSHHLRHDTAPRLYLLEVGLGARLWASRRVDEAFDTLFQRHTFDGAQLLRHSLSFSPVEQSQLEQRAMGNNRDAWLLWSPDLRHAACMATGGKLAFWRCAVCFAGEPTKLKALRSCAYLSAAEATPRISPVEVLPVGRKAWEGHANVWEAHCLPMEDARFATAVTGLPCYPVLRRDEGAYGRMEDWWVHPVALDATQHAPLSLFH